LIGKFPPSARIFVLVLHARGAKRVGFRRFFHRELFESPGRGFCLLGELGALAWRRPITATCDHDRAAAFGIGESKMKSRKSAH